MKHAVGTQGGEVRVRVRERERVRAREREKEREDVLRAQSDNREYQT